MKKMIIKIIKPIIERNPQIAMTYRYMRDYWHLYDEPQKLPIDFKLNGNIILQNGEYEPEETHLVQTILSNIDIFINIGANIGYYCCVALNHGKHVIAFEPMEVNLRYLLHNIKANNWQSQVEVYPLALSNTIGIIELHGSGPKASLIAGWGGVSQQYTTLVPISTVDKILGMRFQGQQCFVLVDIEGAEQAMLQGASALFEMTPKPIWMIEIATTENQPEKVRINPNLLSTFQIFWDHGYDAWTAESNSRLIQREEIEEIMRTGKDSFQNHNFIFIEQHKRSIFF